MEPYPPNLPVVAHVHTVFLPPTEHWIARLTAGVRDFRHVALSARLHDTPPGSDAAHVRHFPHGLEAVAAHRLHVKRRHRYLSALRLIVAGGVAGASLRRLRAAKLRPDIVHVHFGDVAWRWRRLLNRLDVPIVVSFYGHDYGTLPQRDPRWRSRLEWVLAKADLLLAEAPRAASRLVALGADARKVRVINLGTALPDPERLPARHPGAHFLQVATLTPKKAQIDTLRAFEVIAASHPDATVTFVGGDGDAAFAKSFRAAVAASPYAHRVSVRPFAPLAELGELFARADYFVQPSVTAEDGDSEGGAPIALLDAQAHGLPVIVSDHCDLPYVSAELGWNRPVPAGDVEALARVMGAGLLRSVEERLSDRSASRRFVEEDFDVTDWSAALGRAYRSLL